MSANKLTGLVSTAALFILFILKARHRKGHGIHSPYTYELVADVIYDQKKYSEYIFFKELRRQLRNSNLEFEIENIGSPSKKFNNRKRRIADLVIISSINEKHGRLLFRLVRFYKPTCVLELGTSIGLATTYLSKGWPEAKIITIEGNESLCSFAKQLFLENGLENINIRPGLFDELLPDVLSEISNHSLIFIDGNHSYGPTVRYFNSICNYLDECVIVFDDISWSPGMRKAWKEISASTQSQVTIDLYFMGIVIRNKNITPGHYKVRF